jgi:hypothetical protein
MTWWLGAVCPQADGPAAHADFVLLSIMDGLDADLVCTHVDRGDVVARTRMTARLRREPNPTDVVALAERLGQVTLDDPVVPEGSRCIRFPGQEKLTGVLPAADLVAYSAIDEVTGIGVPVTPESPIDTRDFLRPTYENGRLVLLVEPAAGGVLRPVEIADPHECCGGH